MKKTPSLRPENKPARPGVYETTLNGKVVWKDFWDGKRWVYLAYGKPADGFFQKSLSWRGLAENPNKN